MSLRLLEEASPVCFAYDRDRDPLGSHADCLFDLSTEAALFPRVGGILSDDQEVRLLGEGSTGAPSRRDCLFAVFALSEYKCSGEAKAPSVVRYLGGWIAQRERGCFQGFADFEVVCRKLVQCAVQACPFLFAYFSIRQDVFHTGNDHPNDWVGCDALVRDEPSVKKVNFVVAEVSIYEQSACDPDQFADLSIVQGCLVVGRVRYGRIVCHFGFSLSRFLQSCGEILSLANRDVRCSASALRCPT